MEIYKDTYLPFPEILVRVVVSGALYKTMVPD